MFKVSSLIIEMLRSAAIDELTPPLAEHLNKITQEDLGNLNQFSLGPLLAYLVGIKQYDIHPEVKNELTSIKLTSEFLCASKISSLIGIQSIGRDLYLLKGASLFLDVFPESYIRLMGDIDILVRSKRIQEYHEGLTDLGYVQESDYTEEFYETLHHLMPYHKPCSEIWVEVHHHIIPGHRESSKLHIFEPAYFFVNKEYISHEGLSFYRASIELNLLYAITHWVEEFRVRDSAVQLLDIIYIIERRTDLSWERFTGFLNNKHSASYANLVLGYLIHNHIVVLDHGLWRSITQKKKTIGPIDTLILYRIIRLLHDRESFSYRVLGETNLSIIWFELLSERMFLRKYLSVIKSLVFPPGRKNQYSWVFQWSRFKRMLGR